MRKKFSLKNRRVAMAENNRVGMKKTRGHAGHGRGFFIRPKKIAQAMSISGTLVRRPDEKAKRGRL